MPTIFIHAPEPWDRHGAICHMVTLEDENGRHCGELIWSPVSTQKGHRNVDGLEPGWNAWADYDDLGRLAPSLYETRILGIRTMRQAIRALLAQMPINRAEYDKWEARRGKR